MNAPLILRTALKSYPHTLGLKSGAIADPRVSLECLDIDPIYRAFAPMAQRQEYDLSEMAIVTYLQAKAYGKPLVLLPTVVAARLQQGCIVYNANRGPMTVADLPGAKVGVRAYSQTTGMWVRGILANTYGVPLEQVNWVAFENCHLEEYRDPPFVTRAAADQKMLAMLLAGELDAAIFGNDLPTGDGITPLIPDAAQADQLWYRQHRFVPPNHVLVMRRDVAEQHPEAVRAVYDMFKRAKAEAPSTVPANRLPTGIEAMRQPLAVTLDFCHQQKLLPRRLELEEIFADSVEFLGDSGN
jgi:4,5-dihydroxyphthalate decarboxylase